MARNGYSRRNRQKADIGRVDHEIRVAGDSGGYTTTSAVECLKLRAKPTWFEMRWATA